MDSVQNTLTESEMRSFFDRLVNAMMEKTKLHQDVEAMKKQLDEVGQRVTALVSDNHNLRNEVYQTTAQRDQARREADDNKKLADMFSADLERTKAENNQVRMDLVETRNNFYQAKSELEHADKRLASLETARAGLEQDRDYWRTRSLEAGDTLSKTSKELSDTRSKLAKFQEFYKGMFAEVHPEPAPVTPRYEELPGSAPKFDPIPGQSVDSFRPYSVSGEGGGTPSHNPGDNTGVHNEPTGDGSVPTPVEPKPEEAKADDSEVAFYHGNAKAQF